ncbi:Hsp20/alpha crystallin family protein [Salinactinospora qingdaonensis]|uniref:Alpha-crystallin HspX n=1 Tax=Salinactinospora qingdaonensis TaxID=702744 RepID=A0ABP7GPL4_9ACTN
MNRLAHRERHLPIPGFAELFENPFAAFPQMAGMRVEDFIREGRYIVRAELPGVDPEKDVNVTVSHGTLTITAEREEETRERRRTEFHYGSFSRTIALPNDADEDDVSANYSNGILEVSIGLAEAGREGRQIPVSRPGE